MWKPLDVLTVFLMEILQSASAVPGFNTAGTDFVFGCPYVHDGEQFGATIHVTAERHGAVYDLWEPSLFNIGENARLKITHHKLDSYSRVSHRLNSKCRVMYPGLYRSYRVNASSPVYIIFALENKHEVFHISMFKLIPKEICFNKYYISTVKGYAFMSIHTFIPSNITARFPDSKRVFRIPCWGNHDHICRPKAVKTLYLGAYQFWYFVLVDSYADLQNTVIESDNPVFVVAGNTKVGGIAEARNDSIASTMKPTVAWGKVYIVPHFFGKSIPVMLILRFNAEIFPFQVELIHNSTSTKNLFLLAANEAEYIYNEMTRPVYVTADTAFGLHAVMHTTVSNEGSLVDASLINVIPVEQWMDGFVRLWNDFDKMPSSQLTFFFLSTADPPTVSFRISKRIPLWREFLTINNTTFYYTAVPIKGMNAVIYIKNAPGKMMLYIRTQPNAMSSTAFPYDFYQGEIFQANCTQVLPVVSDGVDNDCDGVIDEEVQNDKDDDGDGEVDEDIVETYVDGLWTAWKSACKITCDSSETYQFVRECGNPVPSRFDHTCNGNSTKCDKTPCPTSCPGGDLKLVCSCSPHCSACRNDTAVCDACEPGYYQSPYCLKPCPRGWTGATCSRGPRTIAEFLDFQNSTTGELPNTTTSVAPPRKRHQVKKEHSLSWVWILAVAALVFCFIVFLLLCLILKPKERSQDNYWKEEGQPSEKEESESREEEVQNPELESVMESSVDVPNSALDNKV